MTLMEPQGKKRLLPDAGTVGRRLVSSEDHSLDLEGIYDVVSNFCSPLLLVGRLAGKFQRDGTVAQRYQDFAFLRVANGFQQRRILFSFGIAEDDRSRSLIETTDFAFRAAAENATIPAGEYHHRQTGRLIEGPMEIIDFDAFPTSPEDFSAGAGKSIEHAANGGIVGIALKRSGIIPAE